MFDLFFFFNDTATTEIYTLSLHDALPISVIRLMRRFVPVTGDYHGQHFFVRQEVGGVLRWVATRSEEHTSELQSRQYLVCRLLLEKKKKKKHNLTTSPK